MSHVFTLPSIPQLFGPPRRMKVGFPGAAVPVGCIARISTASGVSQPRHFSKAEPVLSVSLRPELKELGITAFENCFFRFTPKASWANRWANRRTVLWTPEFWRKWVRKGGLRNLLIPRENSRSKPTGEAGANGGD